MRALLLVSVATAQYHHDHRMPRREKARFDDVTGAPLNQPARDILARHAESAATVSGASAASRDAFDNIVTSPPRRHDVAASPPRRLRVATAENPRRRPGVAATRLHELFES